MAESLDVLANDLKAKGFTKEQINDIRHSLHTTTKAKEGDPLGTVVLGDDGKIYVRVALRDVSGPIHHWRVINPDVGDENTFLAEPIVAGKRLHEPESESEK